MEVLLAVMSALWVGILTSISPCPLATNIAAISFVSKKVNSSRNVFFTGLFYTLGRVFVYVLLAILVIKSIYLIPGLSHFLQTQMHKILGPLLIIVGMILLELISINFPSLGSGKVQDVFNNMGIWGAFPLGAIFALSFCPVSAALFFGSLIPLATKFSSLFLLPSFYGIGTGLPVLIFSLLIAFSTRGIEKVFNKVGKFEYWLRMITAVIFIVVGIYLSLAYIFQVF